MSQISHRKGTYLKILKSPSIRKEGDCVFEGWNPCPLLGFRNPGLSSQVISTSFVWISCPWDGRVQRVQAASNIWKAGDSGLSDLANDPRKVATFYFLDGMNSPYPGFPTVFQSSMITWPRTMVITGRPFSSLPQTCENVLLSPL